MKDGSKIRKMFLSGYVYGIRRDQETGGCYVVPTENESLRYYGPVYFGDGISWAILSEGNSGSTSSGSDKLRPDEKELVRWNLQYVMSIVWE